MSAPLAPLVDAWAGTATLAQQPAPPPADPGGQGEDFGKSSPVALVVLLLFFLAVALLVRSMNKHLRRVPESFDRPEERRDDGAGRDEPAGRDE